MNKQKSIKWHITKILEYIGENPSREGLKDTPYRIIRMFNEIFKGYDVSQKPKLTIFKNETDGIKYDEMIFDTGTFHSTCEHHLLTFSGQYYFAYIPNKKILGLSKVARIVDYYSSKLQIQERLGKEIVDELESILKPKGIALVLRAKHLCKIIRGIKNDGETITSDMRGVFRKEQATRNEFLNLIK